MKFWEESGIVDMKKVMASQDLHDFHTHLTSKILNLPSGRAIFEQLNISD